MNILLLTTSTSSTCGRPVIHQGPLGYLPSGHGLSGECHVDLSEGVFIPGAVAKTSLRRHVRDCSQLLHSEHKRHHLTMCTYLHDLCQSSNGALSRVMPSRRAAAWIVTEQDDALCSYSTNREEPQHLQCATSYDERLCVGASAYSPKTPGANIMLLLPSGQTAKGPC